MKKLFAFFQRHMVSWMLIITQIALLIPKLVGWLTWNWWLVFIPSYLFSAWWIGLIIVGAILTKRDERAAAEEEEEDVIESEEEK